MAQQAYRWEFPAPAEPFDPVSYRVVGGPQDFSDDTQHTILLDDNVEVGERVVVFGATSVDTPVGTIGSVTDESGNTYVLDEQNAPSFGLGNAVNAYSARCDTALDIGDDVTIHVTPGWHGMSPYWLVVAINSGGAADMVKDVSDEALSALASTISTPTITTADNAAVFGFFAGDHDSGENWTMGGIGWTEIADTPPGTESTYSIVLMGRLAETSFNGNASGGIGGPLIRDHTLIISYMRET